MHSLFADFCMGIRQGSLKMRFTPLLSTTKWELWPWLARVKMQMHLRLNVSSLFSIFTASCFCCLDQSVLSVGFPVLFFCLHLVVRCFQETFTLKVQLGLKQGNGWTLNLILFGFGLQFYITTRAELDYLDEKHTVCNSNFCAL